MKLGDLQGFVAACPQLTRLRVHPGLLRATRYLFTDKASRDVFVSSNADVRLLETKTTFLSHAPHEDLPVVMPARTGYLDSLIHQFVKNGHKTLYLFDNGLLQPGRSVDDQADIHLLPTAFAELFRKNAITHESQEASLPNAPVQTQGIYEDVLAAIEAKDTVELRLNSKSYNALIDLALFDFFSTSGQVRIDDDLISLKPENQWIDKEVVFVAKNGSMVTPQPHTLRLAKGLRARNFRCTFMGYGQEVRQVDRDIFDRYECFDKATDLLRALERIPYSAMVYQGGMHGYIFGAYLVKRFRNVAVYVTDWNLGTRAEYANLFGRKVAYDFEGIEYIFRNAWRVLTQHNGEEVSRWSKEYDCTAEKFFFNPGFCDPSVFVDTERALDGPEINLVWPGSISPTCYPEHIYPARGLLDTVRAVTHQGLNVDYMLSPEVYQKTMTSSDLFKDVLYEHEFNHRFLVREGRDNDPRVLDNYHFGMFFFFRTSHPFRNEEYYRLNENVIPTKMAFFLEAGIPMICHEKLKYIAATIRENGLGLVVTNEDIYHLGNALRSMSPTQYRDYCRNVRSFRNRFTYLEFDHEKSLGSHDNVTLPTPRS